MPVQPDQIRTMAEQWPDEPGYRVVGGDTLTFGDWRRDSDRLARGLADAGVGKGDLVALAFPPRDVLWFVRAYIAGHQLGAVNVLVDHRFSADEVEVLMGHARPAAVVASGDGWQALRTGLPDSVELAVVVGDDHDGARSWDDIAADDADDLQVELSDDDPADVLYTAGTTGRPKGVLTRHGNATQAPIGENDHFNGTAWLHASPLASIAGQSFVTTPAALGMTGLYLPEFDARTWVDTVRDEQVMACFLVPSMVERIVALDDLDPDDLASLNLVTVGSAPIAPATLRRFAELLPNATPQNNYSLTEIGTGFTMLEPERFAEKAHTVGRPVDPLRIRIVDPDRRDELPSGEVGEVLARVDEGPRREYFRDPEREAEAWEDGWLRTGDLGALDEDGYLVITGRRKDTINRGGHLVQPSDVERALSEHDGVVAVAVVGVPDEILGEAVVAAVVATDATSRDELRGFVDDRLGEAHRPDRIELVDALPRNRADKVDRVSLARRLA